MTEQQTSLEPFSPVMATVVLGLPGGVIGALVGSGVISSWYFACATCFYLGGAIGAIGKGNAG